MFMAQTGKGWIDRADRQPETQPLQRQHLGIAKCLRNNRIAGVKITEQHRADDYAQRAKIAMTCSGRRVACFFQNAQPTRLPPQLRELDVLARIHLEIQRQGILGVRLNDFFRELHEDRVFAKDCVFVHRLKIDSDEEWPVQFGIDSFPALDAKDLWNFEKLHPRIHHHRFHAGRGDLGFKLIENDMMNHEAKANRRFRCGAQVRIHARQKHG